jgi:Dna[CI] antecedent, DciA
LHKQLLAVAYCLSAKVIRQSDKYRFLVQDINFTLNFNSMGQFSLGEAIQQFLNQSRLKGSMQAFQIEEIWEKLMGKTISKYTEKIQIHGNRLYITTFVAPLKQELIYQKDTIMHRVNEALGEKIIKEVIIN